MPELSVHLGLTDTVACWLCRSKSRIEHRRGLARMFHSELIWGSGRNA